MNWTRAREIVAAQTAVCTAKHSGAKSFLGATKELGLFPGDFLTYEDHAMDGTTSGSDVIVRPLSEAAYATTATGEVLHDYPICNLRPRALMSEAVKLYGSFTVGVFDNAERSAVLQNLRKEA